LSNYQITIIALVNSSLPKEELESRLVASLFDVETEQKTSDGDNDNLHIVDYELTEAVPI
jgi:hypothetical protein